MSLSLNMLHTFPTLKMEAAHSSESLAFVCQTIWRPISDDRKLHRNCSLLLTTLFSIMHDHLPTLRETCCIHLQDGGQIYETVWCHNPQDNNLHFHLCDYFMYHMWQYNQRLMRKFIHSFIYLHPCCHIL